LGKITWTHLIDFKVNKANAVLPTQPIIRLIKVDGEQRIDNDIKLDNSTVYPFAVLNNAGKLPDDFPGLVLYFKFHLNPLKFSLPEKLTQDKAEKFRKTSIFE
jgi:hypothetical protein